MSMHGATSSTSWCHQMDRTCACGQNLSTKHLASWCRFRKRKGQPPRGTRRAMCQAIVNARVWNDARLMEETMQVRLDTGCIRVAPRRSLGISTGAPWLTFEHLPRKSVAERLLLKEICKLLSLLSLVRYLFARDVHDVTIGFFDFSSGSSRADLYQSARLIRLQAPCQIMKPQTGAARSFGAAWCKCRTKNLRSVLHQAAPKLLKQQRYGALGDIYYLSI